MFKLIILLFLIIYLIEIKAKIQKNKNNLIDISQEYSINKPVECSFYSKKYFCYNGGKCRKIIYNDELSPIFCICPTNFHGSRCQYLFNPNVYFVDSSTTTTNYLFNKNLKTFLFVGVFTTTMTFTIVIVYKRKEMFLTNNKTCSTPLLVL
uniref:EGF-like domain-containing protein n=1 Tax=Meloidogyne enterolobii TaxID=390850 RepID=A0A6V7UY55_MELEN|nr:unnamed protein product [Meloidogyne enterolobii]